MIQQAATDDPRALPGGAVDPVAEPTWRARGSGDVAALTIDDGPNGATTEELLDALAGFGVRAVFCVVADQVRAPGGAAVLRRIVADGHVLANHSTDFADLGAAPPDEVEERLRTTLALIRDALGDPHHPVPYYRAPNGSWGLTCEVAVALGMQPLAVVNTIEDWRDEVQGDLRGLTDRLRAAMRPGEVVLVHDGGGDRTNTVAAVRTVVRERLAAGWRFTLPVGGPPA
jgi:endo-1,4-beta-xylanase